MYEVTTKVELETWQNTTNGRIIVKRFGMDGNLRDEMVRGKGKINLSSHERRINQDMAIDSSKDPFSNGTFSPVQLIETAEDFETISGNPNLMSDDDMRELLGRHFKQVESALKDINSETLLRRLSEIAEEEDVTMGKARAIEARLAEFRPDFLQEVENVGL